MAETSNPREDLETYRFAGLAGRLASEKSPYALGAIGLFTESLGMEDARKIARKLATSQESGINAFLSIYPKKYEEARQTLTLIDFCDVYVDEMEDETREVLEEFGEMTVGDLEKKVRVAQTIEKDKDELFDEGKKEEAKGDLKKYGEVMGRLQLVEDKAYSEGRAEAIKFTEKELAEKSEEGESDEELEKAA